jgi:hypothetical protein
MTGMFTVIAKGGLFTFQSRQKRLRNFFIMIPNIPRKKGIEELHKTARPGGTFCYTFFKGIAVK